MQRKAGLWRMQVPFLLLLGCLLGSAQRQQRRVTPGQIEGWSVDRLPNPTKVGQARDCGAHFNGAPADATSFLCDPDFILPQSTALMVHKELDRISKDVIIECGAAGGPWGPGTSHVQASVVLVNKMKRTHLSWEPTEEAEVFARRLHDTWGVGDSTCQDGLLMLVSVEDRAMYISRGKGLDRLLTHRRLEDVMEKMKPSLMNRKYDEAIMLGLKQVEKKVKDGPPGFWEEHLGTILFGIVAVVFIGIIVVNVVAGARRDRHRRRAFDDAKRKLERMDREKERLERLAKAGNFGSLTSCPVCLEDFKDAQDAPSAPPVDGQSAPPAPTTASNADVDQRQSLLHPTDEHTRANGDGGSRNSDVPQPPRTLDKLGMDGRPVAVLDCGHAFCYGCLMQSIERSHKCPICRTDIAGGPNDGGSGGGGGGDDDNDDGTGGGGGRRPMVRPSAPPASSTDSSDRQGYGNIGGRTSPWGQSSASYRPSRWGRPGPHTCQPAPVSTYEWVEGGWGQSQPSWTPISQPTFLDPARARVYAEAELLYRLRSLQRQHPDIVTDNHVNRWGREGFSQGSYSRDPTFLSQDPRVSGGSTNGGGGNPWSYSSGGGSSNSGRRFGGGSSSGGAAARW